MTQVVYLVVKYSRSGASVLGVFDNKEKAHSLNGKGIVIRMQMNVEYADALSLESE